MEIADFLSSYQIDGNSSAIDFFKQALKECYDKYCDLRPILAFDSPDFLKNSRFVSS